MKYTLKNRDTGRVREYWCPDSGGVVREVDSVDYKTRTIILGRLVDYELGHGSGYPMHADRWTLEARIKAARKNELRHIREGKKEDVPSQDWKVR